MDEHGKRKHVDDMDKAEQAALFSLVKDILAGDACAAAVCLSGAASDGQAIG
jgi:hypothetical protein